MIALALLVCVMLAALALSSFCSGTESGFSSVSLGRIRHMAREGSAAAKIIERARLDFSRTLTGILVGNNLANVVYSSASAALAARLFGDASGVGAAAWSAGAAVVLLVCGEFLPKLFCSARPLRRTLRLAPVYRVFDLVLAPLTFLAVAVTGLFAGRPRARERVTPDNLLRILQDRKDGVRLTEFESALIARILVLRMKGRPVTAEALLSALDETDA